MVAAVVPPKRLDESSSISRLAERELLGELLAIAPGDFPLAFEAVSKTVSVGDFADLDSRALCSAIFSLASRGEVVTLPAVADELSCTGDLELVGLPGLAELSGEALGSDVKALADARLVRRFACRRRLAEAASRWQAEPENAGLRAEMARAQEALDACSKGAAPPAPIEAEGFTGDRLRELRRRVEPVSPLANLLDPEPHLHVLLGKPKTGKTTFALDLARSWAQGIAPWPGAAKLPGTRALVISREQPVTRIDATMRRLARFAGTGDAWADRVVIVARDRELPPGGRRLLTLDDEGLVVVRAALGSAQAAGEPFGFVVLDSLSRLKPAGIEERDNDGLTAWLDSLESIASECGVWVVLIHHVGHSSDESRKEARSAGRGASAISAVAQVVWLFERVKRNPRLRRLEVDGNAVLPGDRHFEVAGKGDPEGSIHFFRPSDVTAGHDPKVLLAGGPVSVTELARRVGGRDKPARSDLDLAKTLLGVWQGADLIDVDPHGPRGACLLTLKEAFQ